MTYQRQQLFFTLSLCWFCAGEAARIGSEPSVTLQMAPLVKVGQGWTLSPSKGRTMEITGV